MNINIDNETNFSYIKFDVYYTYDRDGIDAYDKFVTDFYNIKNKDTINIDINDIRLVKILKIYIKTDQDKCYRFKYKYTSFSNNLNIKLRDGDKYPVLVVNNCRPDSRREWQGPVVTCCITGFKNL